LYLIILKKAPYDLTINMRMFLNILNEFKLLDRKNLSTNEVVRILATDTNLVFDYDNSYNLDFEVIKANEKNLIII
jgi:hypothetical protein